jgi:hypothetical protein
MGFSIYDPPVGVIEEVVKQDGFSRNVFLFKKTRGGVDSGNGAFTVTARPSMVES